MKKAFPNRLLMSTVTPLESSLTIPVAAPSSVYNEAFDPAGNPRPAWKPLIDAAQRIPLAEFVHRSSQADLLISENGVTFNVFHEGTRAQRPWQLDLLPYIIDAEQWRTLEAGLKQRANLLNWIVRDCHGERSLIRFGALPPEVLFANPGYHRPFAGLHQFGPSIVSAAAELAKDQSGQWFVMADRSESPAGAAFALENRIVASRTIPPTMHEQPVHRLASFFLRTQNTLRLLGNRLSETPRIVLLSPGAKYPYYFEDVYLARYLGYSLVEGADLAVRDHRVYLKTLSGLVPIDVIVSRGVERGIDPLELGGGEPHGVPGLLRVLRDQKVMIANIPGSGLMESPIFMAFLPELSRRCLGEELLLPSIPTWWCGDPQHWAYVREHLDELVIKPAFQASGSEEILPRKLSAEGRRQLVDKIKAQPHQYVAQELIERSAVPIFHRGEVKIGHVALRTFLVADGDDYSVMPGGLARVAFSSDPMELSVSAGVCSKDVWVLADGPVDPVSLLTSEDKPVPLRRTSAIFPSRVADDLFWFGQSLDRADFLSRLLRAVIERLTSESSADTPELPSLIRALADQGQVEASFAIESMTGLLPGLESALPRMVADVDEIRGLSAAISEMYRLASLERLWMSPDTYRKVRETSERYQSAACPGWGGLIDLLDAVNQVILDLAAVSGLIHDGMIRGPAWHVMDMGRRIERVRDTASLLRSLLVHRSRLERPVLRALLEVIDCRMTYRSRYMDNLQQNAVLDLCLTDETCPRSIASQLNALAEHVDALPGEARSLLRTEERRMVMSAVQAVRMIASEHLEDPSTEHILKVLTELEPQLKQLSDVLTNKYLLHSGVPRQINSDLEMP